MRFARIALALAAAVALAAVVVVACPFRRHAQQPPAVPGWDSGVLISYNLADLETAAPLQGFAAEVDFRFADTPISFVGHVSRTDPSAFTGAGLRVTHDLGPFEAFGHYLFGVLKTGTDASDGVNQRRGGGVNVPLTGRLFLRMGADHDGTAVFTVVGLGARW